ncbi:CPBP family intramembrane metalloprotease [Micromonospora zingiberis]|uniref:CPBP family intramembrane metalloprotease n=1 Tax=Micromonospora zingiberis TaxID=2053011 RepID=A0A4R0G5I7_9ACTN|nr:type II CAAX endopeptidase family protein [Micromonospora zingiberis]TCB91626.1 CPBP family intramembrane metalloprotease [Micromonospora zingiberis]
MPMHMPPAGTPYHRLTTRIPRWRTLLALVAVLIATQVAPIPAILLSRRLLPEGLPILGDFTPLALSLVAIACILPVTLLIIRVGEGRRFGTLASVTGRLSRWLLAVYGGLAAMCLGMVVVIGTTVMIAVALTTTTSPPERTGTPTLDGIGGRLSVLPILLCLIVVQVTAEEVVARGVILQAVGRLTRSPWPAIVVQAAVFTALHGAGELWGTVSVLVVGIALGWITVRTGGLEAALAFHIVVNGLAGFSAVVFGATSPTDNAVDGSWPQALVIGGAATAYVLFVNVLIRPLEITTTVTDPQVTVASHSAAPCHDEQHHLPTSTPHVINADAPASPTGGKP